MRLPARQTLTSKIPAEPDWIKERRSAAAKIFGGAPRPSFKYGLGISFDPAAIHLPFSSSAAARPGAKPAVGGGQGTVLTWAEALARPATAARMKEYLRDQPPSEDKIWSWHEANCAGGLVIHLGRGLRLKEPIRLEYAQTEPVRLDRLLIIAEPGSSAAVTEHLGSVVGAASWRGLDVGILAKNDSRVDYVAVQNLASGHTAFARKRALCGSRAAVSWIECAFGGDLISDDAAVELRGSGASAALHNLFFGSAAQRFDLNQRAIHLAPATDSKLFSRGALDDRARAVCRGLIRMERGSNGCQGRQKADTLLLKDSAGISTIPALEINEADVSCGHASATGRLDPEDLFYLMSRGLDEAAAVRQLLYGFFAPTVREMRDHGLEDMVTCLIGHRLGAVPDEELKDRLCAKK